MWRGQCVVRPDQRGKMAWDFFQGCLIMYTCLTVPLEIAFGTEDNEFYQFVGFLIEVFFIFDLRKVVS